jgi:hypothetical protein
VRTRTVLQMAVRQQVGIVILPWSFTDPGYGCFPHQMLSMSGGKVGDGDMSFMWCFVVTACGCFAQLPSAHWRPKQRESSSSMCVCVLSFDLSSAPIFLLVEHIFIARSSG